MTLYAIGLSNGLETYTNDPDEARRIFNECAAEGYASLAFIRKCSRHYLAFSINRQDAPTLGHYEAATFRARRMPPSGWAWTAKQPA